MIETPELVTVYMNTRKGNRVEADVRPDTTDAMTLEACIVHDEYELAAQDWTGVAVDVGAHVGGVTLALLADNPDLHVVAVEALPANVELLRRNVERNGFQGRCTIYEGAASCSTEPVTVAYGTTEGAFENQHRFIGGAIWQDTGPQGTRVTVNPVSLSAIVRRFGFVSLVKIDCEGCEWSFLADPAVRDVGTIVGEYHPRGDKGPRQIVSMLEDTHVVVLDESQPFGPFKAVRW